MIAVVYDRAQILYFGGEKRAVKCFLFANCSKTLPKCGGEASSTRFVIASEIGTAHAFHITSVWFAQSDQVQLKRDRTSHYFSLTLTTSS